MSIREKLQIILITYNRANKVQKVLEQFFYKDSPVYDYDFLVLDNNSTDNTKEIVEQFAQTHPNVKYRKNKYNLGISGNIAKAMEIADKDYVWIIGDDDIYDFSNWKEVENAINNNEKIICVARYALPDKYKNNPAYQLLQLTFITGGIYSTKLFNDTIIKNVFDNIYTIFPHICPTVQFINDNGKIYVVHKAISDNGMDMATTDYSYIRGTDAEQVYIRTKTLSWIVGYCNVISKLKDRTLKEHAIDIAIPHEHIYQNYENFYNHIKTAYHDNETFMQFIDIYSNIGENHKQRLKKDFLEDTNPNKCDICKLSTKICILYLLNKIKDFIYSMKKTEDRRVLTIMGFKIKTRRRCKCY